VPCIDDVSAIFAGHKIPVSISSVEESCRNLVDQEGRQYLNVRSRQRSIISDDIPPHSLNRLESWGIDDAGAYRILDACLILGRGGIKGPSDQSRRCIRICYTIIGV